jgi:hypothetical protein
MQRDELERLSKAELIELALVHKSDGGRGAAPTAAVYAVR